MALTTQQDYIDLAVKRYSSLFSLPSHGRIILYLVLLCFLGISFALIPFTLAHIALVTGAGFFCITILSDYAVYGLLRSEPVYDLRRCHALSFFSNLIWCMLMLLGAPFGWYFRDAGVWLKFFLFGFCAVSLLRLLVFSATLFKGYAVVFVSALFQPAMWVVFLYFMWIWVANVPVSFSSFVFPLVSIPVVVATISLFVYVINRVGKKTLGVSSVLLLKSFLATWINDVNGPLENVLEGLGTEQSVDVSLLAFKTKKGMKVVMVVPAFHPGPFKNVGSSLLPYLIQSTLEQKLNCAVAVPHGLFGHELDLASQAQNQKVLDAIVNSLDFHEFSDKASLFMRAKSDVAGACCQVFSDRAMLALTVAPETTEDLPQALGFLAIDEAKKNGLASAVVINAHNSINDAFRLEEAMIPLKQAVAESLEKASRAKRSTLEVGAAKIVPAEFSLEDGMGPGGISAVVTRVDEQTTAYVTIDGNNMVSGLREKLLGALKEIGVDDGEILTTDTHAVSAVVLNRRGYHPVGEVMDHEKLTGYVRNVVLEALGSLEPVRASWQTITVPNVKVIGAEQLQALSMLTDKASAEAKKSAALLFPVVCAVLIGLLLLL